MYPRLWPRQRKSLLETCHKFVIITRDKDIERFGRKYNLIGQSLFKVNKFDEILTHPCLNL